MYLVFAAMITTSTVTMFLLTYTNAFTWAHMTFSEEGVYPGGGPAASGAEVRGRTLSLPV